MKKNIFIIWLFLQAASCADPRPGGAENSQNLFCDKSNYKEFIYSRQKTDKLIYETQQGCQLQNLNFSGGSFQGAILYKADFRFSNCRNANFQGANLEFAELTNADFTGADFRAAIVHNTDIAGSILDQAVYNSKTLFPPHFDPTEHNMIYKD